MVEARGMTDSIWLANSNLAQKTEWERRVNQLNPPPTTIRGRKGNKTSYLICVSSTPRCNRKGLELFDKLGLCWTKYL